MGVPTPTLAVLLGVPLPGPTPELLAAALSAGLLGSSILDRLRGEEEETEAASSDGEDPLLGDEGSFAGDDGGDEFDEFEEEWDDDPFDGGDAGGDDGTAELENRIDELETEVASLSSTVGTVRSENEQISETVEDVEEDVRQLLDIYEMVTRGINPFVDDAGGLGGEGIDDDGSFGLFEDEDGDDEDGDLDPEVADADAEGFFDEELVEPSDEDPFAEELDDGDDLDEDLDGDGFEEAFEADDDAFDETDDDEATHTEDDAMATDDTGGGKSFEELKAEYDSGDADWADEADDDADDDVAAESATEETASVDDDSLQSDDPLDADDGAIAEADLSEPGDDGALGSDDEAGVLANGAEPDEPATEDGLDAAEIHRDAEAGDVDAPANGHAAVADDDSGADDQPDSRQNGQGGRATTGEGLGPSGPAAGAGASAGTGGFNFLGDDAVEGPDRPYLDALPGGYVSDLLVMEWLEFLVEEGSVTDAARAVNYYHRVGWVAEPVATDLQEFLTGFGDVDLNRVNEPGCDHLTPAHHQKSLKYVMQLSEATAESIVVDRWDELAGVGNGI